MHPELVALRSQGLYSLDDSASGTDLRKQMNRHSKRSILGLCHAPDHISPLQSIISRPCQIGEDTSQPSDLRRTIQNAAGPFNNMCCKRAILLCNPCPAWTVTPLSSALADVTLSASDKARTRFVERPVVRADVACIVWWKPDGPGA